MDRFRVAYNSNGLQEMDAVAAIRLLADVGYDAIELALVEAHFDPLRGDPAYLRVVKDALAETGLGVLVGAGVPYGLSEERFEPSLFHPDPDGRALRRTFLSAAIEVAAELGSPLLVLCTGVRRAEVTELEALALLDESLASLGAEAEARGVRLALEPEPGHLIETFGQFAELVERVGPRLGLALDVGHAICTESEPLADVVAAALATGRLEHVQIEDVRDRQHVHLPLGDGDLDFPPLLAQLRDGAYSGYLGVELNELSHEGERRARESLPLFRAAEDASASA